MKNKKKNLKKQNEVKDSDLQKLMLAVITEEEEMIDPKD